MGAAASRRATAPTGAVLVAPGANDGPALDVPAFNVIAMDDPITGNRTYLAAVGDGIAIVVDPPRDIDPIRDRAADDGTSIVAAFETHLHGDHISGARELQEEGVVVVAPVQSALTYPYREVRDGTVVLVGDVEVHTCTTAGHTDDHVAYVVVRDGTPIAVFGGGLLTPSGIDLVVETDDAETDDAVTDENGGDGPEALTAIDIRRPAPGRTRIDRLAPDTPVYLTHPAPDWPDTVGELATRSTQPLRGNGPRATDVATIVDINRHGPRLLRDVATPAPLEADEVTFRVGRGAWLVDARRSESWAAGHAPLSVSVPAGPWFAWLLPRVAPPGATIVLLADDDTLEQCIASAHACGHDGLVGWLDGGWPAWLDAEGPTRITTLAAPAAVASLRAAGLATIDVRTDREREALRLPATEHLALPDLAAGMTPEHDDLVLVCSDGIRAAAAASLLEPRGARLQVLAGGLAAWQAAGFAVLQP